MFKDSVEEFWFRQDGATCHTVSKTIALLQGQFDENIISRNGPVSQPPRSYDLTQCDFFLSGYVRSKVYANNPAIEDFKTNLRTVIREIPATICESHGTYFDDTIFKI